MGANSTVTWHFFSTSFNARPVQTRNSYSCSNEAYTAVRQLDWDVISFLQPRLSFLFREAFKI